MNENQTHVPAKGLVFNGRAVSMIDLSGAILMTYFLSWASGSAALEAAGLPYDAAGKWALMIMPAVITMLMILRGVTHIAMRAFNMIRTTTTMFITMTVRNSEKPEDVQ